MADSPDTARNDPTLRIGGWLPETSHRDAPAAYPGHPTGRRPVATPGTGPTADPVAASTGSAANPTAALVGSRSGTASGGPERALLLGCAAVGVLAALVLALSPFWPGPDQSGDQARPPAAPAALGSPDLAGLESPTPIDTYTTAAASLNSRAPAPPRAATPAPTTTPAPVSRPSRPGTGTSTGPAPTTIPPKPPADQDPGELQPLPAWQESSLRSGPNGASTYIEFVNTRRSRVVVNWLDHGGQRQRYAVLGPGRSYRQQTYVGHPWVVTDRRGRALVCFLPAPTTQKAVVR
ncbi:hypothetical protein [Micromonospora sp. NPDC092111]|uniref:VHL beta domain-containing protein n=1 Tax=Micromonospora sp. NPDC092111 TaxID=3364289 RepID=UPI003803E423